MATYHFPGVYLRQGLTRVYRAPGVPIPAPPPTPQPGVPLAGQIFPLAEGLFAAQNCPQTTSNSTIPVIPPASTGGSTAFRDAVLAESPKMYLRLGESSGTSAVDSSGNGNGLTIVGAPTLGVPSLVAPDLDDRAAQFAAGKYLTSGGRRAGLELQRFTLMGMFKASAPIGGRLILLRYDSTDSHLWGRGFSLYAGADYVQFDLGFNQGSYFGSAVVVGTIAAGSKHIVFATWDGANMQIVWDGGSNNIIQPTPYNTVSYANPSGLFVGLDPSGGGADVGLSQSTTLDEIAIFPAALPYSRIQALAALALAA